MSKTKYSVEECTRIAQACLTGGESCGEAARRIGADREAVKDWVRQYAAEGSAAFLPREKNRKYSPELKKAAVLEYLAGGSSQQEICKKYKIRDRKTLRTWIKVYNGQRDFKKQTGGSRMTKARKTTMEERITIAKECVASGRKYGEIAIKYNVSYQQVYNWTNKFAKQGESGLEDRRGQRTAQQRPRTPEEEMKIRIAQLEHENYMLRMERNLLKKLDEIERRQG